MSSSKCGNCGSYSFELVAQPKVEHSLFTLTFVQCTSCGVPIGAMDYLNIGDKLNTLEERIKLIELTVSNIDKNITDIGNTVKKKKLKTK